MKNLSLSIIILLFGMALSAKEQKAVNIPAKVKDSFTKQYPNASKVKWEMEGKSYEVGFIDNQKHKISLVIDADGKIVETETTIAASEAPKVIIDYVTKNQTGAKITEVAKIVDSKGTIKYEVEITKGKKRTDLSFDGKGNLIKK
ncbi:MAG: PepSY-like domain-containing protein [Candidatus Kapabacteria bacterium]|nr:PepSY-like domain-containing protein [Candidatus Kapabacteria bacterium]